MEVLSKPFDGSIIHLTWYAMLRTQDDLVEVVRVAALMVVIHMLVESLCPRMVEEQLEMIQMKQSEAYAFLPF